MKYCLLSISCMFAMLFSPIKLPAQEKIDTTPKRVKVSEPPKPTCTDTTRILGEFDHVPLHEMLRQVSEWYKVNIDYNRIPNDAKVTGTLSKSLKLPELLQALNEMYRTELILKDSLISNKTGYPGWFDFDQTPLKKALLQITKRYKVKVNYHNIPNVKITGSLMTGSPLSEVIGDLNFMSGAKLKITNGLIINQQ